MEAGDAPASHHFPSSVEDHYRMIYFEAIDVLASCLKDRFAQDDFEMYATLEQVLLKGAKGESFEIELAKCSDFYGADFNVPNLRAQLQTLAIQIRTAYPDTDCLLSDIVGYFKILSKAEISLLSQVVILIKLIIVMPATNAVNERSFSAMRRLKNYLRSRMDEARLNHLMILHVHKARTDSLNMINVANAFVASDHRQEIFGTFSELDLSRTSVLQKSRATQTSSVKCEEKWC
ncbi:zinc finger MYM-type protein 1-like [Littorina saxatilis]